MHPHLPRPGRRRSALAVGGLTLALTLAGLAPAVADPTASAVSLTAAPAAAIGDTIVVGVDLTGTTDVYTYEVTLGFDPAVLAYVADSATGPGGGFTTVAQGAGSVTLVHTRLGTSPTISGDLAASVSFTAVGGGSAAVRATSVTLVDGTGGDLLITPTSTTTTTEIAAAVVTPTPAPTPTATTPAPTTAPTAPAPTTASPSSSGQAPTSSTTAPKPATATSGSLARTGFAAGAVLLLAASAIGAGVLLVRRRSAGAR